MAEVVDVLASRATSRDTSQAFERLAARLRAYAVSGATVRLRPGAPAPLAGIYELRNVFGTRAGDTGQARKGQLLPRAPREFTWHLVRQT
jgi:hypothetical protein